MRIGPVGLLITGTAIGGVVGATWGLLGSGGYEAIDSAIGTGVLGAFGGAILTAPIALMIRRNRKDSNIDS